MSELLINKENLIKNRFAKYNYTTLSVKKNQKDLFNVVAKDLKIAKHKLFELMIEKWRFDNEIDSE